LPTAAATIKNGLQWLRFKQTRPSGNIEIKIDNQVTDLKNKTFFATEEKQQRASFTTVHFDLNGLTFALTKCDGMNCVAVMDYPWFAVYNGKKVSAAIFAIKARSHHTPLNSSETSKAS
jgi:hypothetical protein